MAGRREFLRGGVAAGGALAAACVWAGSAQAATRLSLIPLAGRLSRIEGGAANIVVASAGNELVLVDGGAAVDAGALRKLLTKHYPGHTLGAVFNTHWHAAQSGFNATARKQGAEVIAHENTRLWLSTEVNSRWERKVYKPQPTAALPNRTFFYDAQKRAFGGGQIEYAHMAQAHTDGDIYVRFPEENVIVTGDVLAPGRYPVIDTATNGYLGGVAAAQRTIAALCDAKTQLVPGSGAVVTLPVLQQQLDMNTALLLRMNEIYRKGGTFADLVAMRPTRDFDVHYGDPAQFLRQAFDSAWYQANSMGGIATGLPAAAPAGRSQ